MTPFGSSRVPATDEDSVVIYLRFDKDGYFFELSEIFPGDSGSEAAELPQKVQDLIADGTSAVGVAHVHPSTERGRLSGDDLRATLRSGVSVSADAVSGERRGEAEVYIPDYDRSNVPAEAKVFYKVWTELRLLFNRFEAYNGPGEKDTRFSNAPAGARDYMEKHGKLIIIDITADPSP